MLVSINRRMRFILTDASILLEHTIFDQILHYFVWQKLLDECVLISDSVIQQHMTFLLTYPHKLFYPGASTYEGQQTKMKHW